MKWHVANRSQKLTTYVRIWVVIFRNFVILFLRYFFTIFSILWIFSYFWIFFGYLDFIPRFTLAVLLETCLCLHQHSSSEYSQLPEMKFLHVATILGWDSFLWFIKFHLLRICFKSTLLFSWSRIVLAIKWKRKFSCWKKFYRNKIWNLRENLNT